MIPLMRHAFYRERETLKALSDWLLTYPTQLSMGPQCAEFECQFAAWQGRKYAVLFNSGASANLAVLQSLHNLGMLKDEARVGFSALTWATNVMPIIQMGFKPIPVDIDPCTLNIDSWHMINAVDALFVTNALGFLPDLEHLKKRCADEKILLIEDNCESLGSTLEAGKSGNFGFAATFSFFVAHHMSTIEGGMVCTDNILLRDMLMMVRANGWDRNLPAAAQYDWRGKYNIPGGFEAKYTFYVPAFNMRPTEITGFLGIQQLKYLDESIAIRERIYNELETVSLRNPDFVHLRHDHMVRLSPFGFPVLCRSAESRNEYVKRFGGAGVEIRPIIAGNITKQPFYKTYHDGAELPGTDMVDKCGLYFGIYPELSQADIELLKSCLSGS